MNKVALLIEMTAKPGKEEELAHFLTVTRQPMAAEEPWSLFRALDDRGLHHF
jgi:hypothetical protein